MSIGHLGVVIPARNEQERVSRCLESVDVAATHVAIPVTVVLVADCCRDRTAGLASDFGVTVIEIEAGNVGIARAVGADAVIALGADWIANTDADSRVPPEWLAVHLELAQQGADVVAGTVRPDFSELDDGQREAWWRTHGGGQARGNVYGANLGVRVADYLDAGGFRPLSEHEDNDLVRRLVGRSIVTTERAEVITSGRPHGRTPGGFARYLRERLTDPHPAAVLGDTVGSMTSAEAEATTTLGRTA